jgi:peptidoglycan/xylan/chitin deacetylase (PgdA/CDA1 family)
MAAALICGSVALSTGDAARASGTTPPLSGGFPKARLVTRIDTNDRVAFITIDDGRSVTDSMADFIRDNKIPVTSFVLPEWLKKLWEPTYSTFSKMTFENHTNTHRRLGRLSLDKQTKELCEASRLITKIAGVAPRFFRPPGGVMNNDTLKAASACGMPYVVKWSVDTAGGVVNPVGARTTLQRGDIILLHYIPQDTSVLKQVMKMMKESGLKPALLRDYLP